MRGTAAGIGALERAAGIGALERDEDVAAAATIAARCHARLRAGAPHLPDRRPEDYVGKIRWLTDNGVVLGLWQDGRLSAFLGGFLIEDFRNAGPACFAPDWAHGAEAAEATFGSLRALYRAIAPRWIELGGRIHALGVRASEADAIEALSLCGFGRIMVDAAAPTSQVAARTAGHPAPADVSIRRAVADDAEALAAMNARLAEHIAASPILLPDARGEDADDWRSWFAAPDAVALVAEDDTGAIGYIKAQDPQLDVSDAVHDASCLAINGMYCEPARRGRGVGTALVSALADHAAAAGKELMSVDCETHNLEAFGFWTRLFTPVAWGFERRV